MANVHTLPFKTRFLPCEGKVNISTHDALSKKWKTTIFFVSSSVLVSHSSFLEANGGELLGKLLNLALQLSNFWRHIGL